MENSAAFFNSLDYSYIVLIFLSTIIGFSRGFTKDFLSTCTWLGSGFVSVLFYPYLVPLFSKYFTDGTVAKLISASVAYLVVLFIASIIISIVSRKVKESIFAEMDRTIGLLFGLLRGISLLVCIYVFLLMFGVGKNIKLIEESKLSIQLFTIAEILAPKVEQTKIVTGIKKTQSKIQNAKSKKLAKEVSDDDQKQLKSLLLDLLQGDNLPTEKEINSVKETKHSQKKTKKLSVPVINLLKKHEKTSRIKKTMEKSNAP